jgi:hypothetical protein
LERLSRIFAVKIKKKEESLILLLIRKSRARVPGSLRCPPGNGRQQVSTIREYYEKWLPSLSSEIMTSKDLLNQVLVCFTIKRA